MQTTTPLPAPPAPRKSRRRYYIGGFLLALLAAPMAYYFIAGWWGERQMAELTREMDAEDPNWRWPELIAEMKIPPDEQNSAVQLLKIQGLLKATPFRPGPKWENATTPMKYRNSRLAQEQVDAIRAAFVAMPKDTVAEMRKLKDLPTGAFAFELADNPFMIKLEYVQSTREVVHSLECDAYLRAHDRDLDGASESCMAMLNTAHALKDQPFLIGQLVRNAQLSIAVGAIERTLGQGTVSEANLLQLQTMLESAAAADGLHFAMRGERASGHQAYLNLRSGKITFAELLGGTGLSTGVGERLLDTFPGIILNGYPGYLRLMNENVRASKLRDVDRAEAFLKVEQQVREHRGNTLISITRRNLLIGLIMPATAKVAESSQRVQAQLRCTIVAVAVERYRLKHNNAWPVSLDDLVKTNLLKEIPRDPFDGQALRFKRTPTGVVIYSVGLDKIDDGGKLDRTNPRTPGTDLGFELWDRRGIPAPAEEEAR